MTLQSIPRALAPEYLAVLFRLLSYRCRYRGSYIHATARVRRDSLLEAPVVVGAGAELYAANLGAFTNVGESTRIESAGIGRFCSVASHAAIGGGTHPSRGWVSTSPAFFSTRGQAGVTFVKETRFCEIPHTSVGNDVWIGYGAIILPGVRIGDGAIVGAGAVVTHSVGDFEIVAGVPARVVRKRFTEEDCHFLAELRWWDWDLARLRAAAGHFHTVTALKRFLQTVGRP
jgi:acetyltransferase-like isoleucine patch superfamily enzyme